MTTPARVLGSIARMSTGPMLICLLALSLLAQRPHSTHAFRMVSGPSSSMAVERRVMIGGRQCSAARIISTSMTTTTTLAATRPTSESSGRRAFVAALGTFVLLSKSDTAPPAWADVADGNALPKEAQQFANVIQLKTNIKDVRRRLLSPSDGVIEKKEWDSIDKFLRTSYSTADRDMKGVARGVSDPAKQERAMKDVDQVKRYAQAGDVSASQQDAAGLADILNKMSALIDDFFDALSDVPDEI